MALLWYLKSDERHSLTGCYRALVKEGRASSQLAVGAEILCSGNMSPHLAGQEYPDAKTPSACPKQSAGFKAQMTHTLFLISLFNSGCLSLLPLL